LALIKRGRRYCYRTLTRETRNGNTVRSSSTDQWTMELFSQKKRTMELKECLMLSSALRAALA
jgi:hypothetical protein